MDGATAGARTGYAVLGPLEVRHDGVRVRIGGRRLRALLTSLLLTPGRTVAFDTLVAGVWPSDPPTGVGNALQALVSRLRGSLGRDSVVAETSGYRLAIAADQVDAHRFARLAAAGRSALARGDADEAARLLGDALALWRGPALADLAGCAVAGAEIARLDVLRLSAMEDHIDARLLLGRNEEAVGALVPLIAGHPLRERPRGQLMRALYASGRQVEALAAYEAARAAFAEELGTDPSPELAGLHLSMLRGTAPPPASTNPHAFPRVPEPDIAAPKAAPVLAAPENKKGNLRARLTSFVGREHDVERAGELLARNRLVTLLGPGGAGKTRLAVESGEALAGRMPDGVWLAELAPVSDPEGVPQAVLAALGMRDGGRSSVRTPAVVTPEPVDPVGRLVAGLAGRRQLVILDNCEHLVEAAAALAERLLSECPGIRILATSREPLGIPGELVWSVRPLDQAHARSLFADRAATARPGYAVEDEADAVARVCRELDGMPLAIELAAARLRTLSARQIADRLDDRFRLLTGGSRTALPRHQTLRAVVEWSWDLLDERERLLAARFAVFAGGATLEAVERVCSDERLPPEDVLDVLARLVDKSLVVHENTRYRMLETIRAYAAERLAESGEQQAMPLAQARFFTELAELAEPELRRPGQVEWMAVLAAEHDNLTAALRFAVATADFGLGLRLVGALGWYWFLAGRRSEGAQRAAEVLALAPEDPGTRLGRDDPGSSRRLAMALAVHGILLVGGTSCWQEAKDALNRAVALARAGVPRPWPAMLSLAEPVLSLFMGIGPDLDGLVTELFDDPDPWVVASGHLLRAHAHYNAGRIDQGEGDVRAAVDGFRTVGDRWGVSAALGSLAEASTLRGDDATTIAVIREALALADEIGAVEDTTFMRTRLAMALSASGDRAGAEDALDEAMEICRATGDRLAESGVQSVRADLAREEGDFALARRLYDEARRFAADPRVPLPAPYLAVLCASVGMLAEQEGDLRAARETHTEALRLVRTGHDGPATGLVLIAVAGLLVREGDATRAATLLGAAARIRGIDTVIGYDHVRITDAAIAALGRREYSRHHAHGRTMTDDEALALAQP
ncbi:AfsR/SARP family transcriptional regulator [Sphaerisporangium album]|uniref:AfsR/SARP family transcriptional regulator n=1 Tax=Sphaerisporangium album TaxID=509200 RepID=A0A367FLQ3_9ACTN|nr:BTAD domain-containing putative transcriptional regulator [Sphaerisporangium album]RCG30590.1 AfsR/SARP family transcriptional regulator [Sphaerisporangium album]